MATKENGLLLKQQQLSSFNQSDKSIQFFNLHLNQGHKCCSDDASPVHSFSKLNHVKNSGNTVTHSYQENGKSWNKSAKDLSLKASKNLNHFNDDNDNRKRWMKNDKKNSLNSSTLSLHIAAYENSVEDNSDSQIEDASSKSKAFKLADSEAKFLESFEFPRQMDGNKDPSAPEIQQFKASQKLVSPNQASSTEAQPPMPPKKKGKKKKIKVKPHIPKTLTANLGESQKKERESDPEVFEKVTKPKPKPAKSDESSSTSASSNSAESSTKSITNSTQSLPKLTPRPSKCVHEDGQDKTVEYKIDVGRTYSQSSGTLSYDSVFVADESKVNTFRATGVIAKPVEVKIQTTKVIDLNAQKHIEETTALNDEEYRKLVYGPSCPPFAAPTPEYLFGRREQQLTKEAIMVAVEEYFAVQRDDMDLTIRVQRHGAFPILDIKITPNPRTNFIETLSTSGGASSQYYSSASSSSSTSILKAVSMVSVATAKSIKSVISQGFDYLVAFIQRRS